MPPYEERNLQGVRSEDWQIRPDYHDARRIGGIARAGFQAVYEGWQGLGISRDDVATQTAVEAQVAASCLGHKPLYFDPWGASLATSLAEVLRSVLPPAVTVKALPSGLVIFCEEKVRPILDADPGFYRPNGEDVLEAIHQVCASGENGELLGYGARNWFEPQGARVTIRNFDRVVSMFFVSNPADAEYFARERLSDIATYTGERMRYAIEYAAS